MHAAPSVSYPVGRSRAAAWLAAALLLLALGVTALWTLQAQQFGWRQQLAWAAVAACAWAAAWQWRRVEPGELCWDGASWHWQGQGARSQGALRLALDLQAAMLVRIDVEGGAARWCWLDRAAEPARWAALRRAVYSPARAAAPRGTDPPVARP